MFGTTIGGIGFKEERLVEAAQAILEKVLGSFDLTEGVKPDLQDMFSSDFGRLLGRQVDEVLDFAMRGLILSSFMTMMRHIEEISKGIVDGELDGLTTSDTEPNELEKFNALKLLMADYDWAESITSIEELLPKQDRLWYASTLNFAIYAYLDRYTRSLVHHISANAKMSQEIDTYLARNSQEPSERWRLDVTHAEDLIRFGVEKRVREIERGLKLGSVLEEIVGKETAGSCRRNFRRFMEIRHKMAHHDPRPEFREHTWEVVEQSIPELDGFDFPLKEGILRSAFDGLASSLRESFPLFAKIVSMALAGILYPALIDGIVAAREAIVDEVG